MVVLEPFVRLLVLERRDTAAEHHRHLRDALRWLEVGQHGLEHLGLLSVDLVFRGLDSSWFAWPGEDPCDLLTRAEDYAL